MSIREKAEITHTVERECRPLGGHVRMLHIPSNPSPYMVLADYPWASEGDTRVVLTKNFMQANKAYTEFKKLITARGLNV